MTNQVGSVSAEIILDTKQFEEAVSKLKGEVKEIKESFTQKTGNNGLLDDVKKLKNEIDSLQSNVKDYKNALSTVKKENENLTKTNAKLNKELEKLKKNQSNFNKELVNEQKNLDNATKSASKYISLQERMTKWSSTNFKNNLKNKGMGDLFSLGSGRGKYADFSQWIKLLNTGKTRVTSFVSTKQQLENWKNSAAKSFQVTSNELNIASKAFKLFNVEVEKVQFARKGEFLNTGQLRTASQALTTFNRGLNTTILDYRRLKSAGKPFDATLKEINNASQALTKFNQILPITNKGYISVADATKQAGTAAQSFYQTLTKGTQSFQEANSWAKRYGRTMSELKAEYKANSELYAQMRTAQYKYWRQVRATASGNQEYLAKNGMKQPVFSANTIGLQDYYTNVNKAKKATTDYLNVLKDAEAYSGRGFTNASKGLKLMNQELTRSIRLEKLRKDANYLKDNATYSTKNLTQASNALKLFNNQLQSGSGQWAKYDSQIKTTNSSLKTGQASMRQFGTTMGKSEAYANNLYRGLQKVRSVIVSIKTIAGALGTMAVWNFAFDLIDKAKETYVAKNEMDSLLARNSHVDATGQAIFNQELDKTVKKFQKINKYNLGETAASVGLEFDLNGKEMAKSLDVIAMVQSEYIRAGRTSEEAALAVKDILQGEFQRLSRETGVGKDDLKDKYGWNGNTEDVQGLMDALKKAGEARHWDAFAAKATSVNDVITITQSRFSEFGADLMTNAEPMIVEAFNLINGALDTVKNGFNGLNGMEQTFLVGFGGLAAFKGVTTAIMMLRKNIGLVDIATMGWTKSLATSITGLKRADVINHGFLRTLIATVSGTNAASTANIRLGKVLLSRVLGVNANIAAEEGFLKAMMVTQGVLRGESEIMTLTASSGLNLSQKLAAVTNNLSATEVQGMKTSTAIRKIATSAKVLRLAALGIVAVPLTVWLGSVAMWADSVKKRMETYNDVLTNGKDEIKSATKTYEQYNKKLNEMKTTDKNYDFLKNQRDTAKHNLNDLKLSLKLAKQIKKTDEENSKAHDLTRDSILNKAYARSGVDTEKYGQKYLQMKQVAYDIQKSEDERYKFEYKSLQHINEHIGLMEKAKVSEEDRVKYITEYSSKAKEAAENLKKFNQGDLQAGAYFLLNQAQLVLIDLWNDKDFINFWNSVKKTFNELKPTLTEIKNDFLELGRILLKFFSSDTGRWIGTIGLMGGAIGLIVGKMSKWVSGNNIVVGGLKKLGSSLVQRIKDWKGVGKAAEEANTKSGGTTPTTTSTGGINGGVEKGKFWETAGQDARNIGRSYAKAAVHIAGAMVLITEAIVLINLPMVALAKTGEHFKSIEPQIRKGIDGLKLITPVMMALLPPVIALYYLMDKYSPSFTSIVKGGLKSAIGIAIGMGLVTEVIYLLKMPLWSIGEVGKDFISNKPNVNAGVEAMKTVSDSLQYLLPFVPALAGGILLGIAVFESGLLGGALTLAVIGGVALGIGLVAETIYALKMPLWSIGELGKDYSNNISDVKKGAEAIKVTAEALGYVNDAMTSLTGIDLNLFAQTITQIVSSWLGFDLNSKLTDLTGEDGVLSQLSKFIEAFNSDDFIITSPDPDKVTALAGVGDGMNTISDAMSNVQKAMDSIPDEFKNNGKSLNYDAKTNKTSVADVDVSGYFDTFKEPIRQLKGFIDDFNTSDEFAIDKIDSTRVANLSSSADMLTTVNSAVEKVKTVMGNIGDSQWNTAYAQGGIFGAIGNYLYHATGAGSVTNGQGSGDYKSSLGSQLKEMEDVVSDIFTFQSNINNMSSNGGENANVDGATAMVTTIENAISKLASSLSNAVPQFEGKGNAISQAIIKGLNNGLNSVPDIPAKIANKIMSTKGTLYNTANSLGKTTATRFKDGVNPMSEYMTWEISYVKTALNERKSELGDDAYNLGSYLAGRFRNGLDSHSPGLMARTVSDEMSYIGGYLDEGLLNLPQKAFNLANSLGSNFKLDFGLGGLQLPNTSQLLQGLNNIPSTVSNVKAQVTTNFNDMKTGISTNFTNITDKTRSSMSNMLSMTTKNIGGIKSSWRGMQSALIASAEHIRSQTTSKIDKIKTNMGDFWNKIQHPDRLISGVAGGKPTGTIRRRFGSRTLPKGNYAGKPLFKPRRSRFEPSDFIDDAIKCQMMTGKPCYAGWSYNWTDKIKDKFHGWNTHFNKFNLDSHLNVGKFNDSNFPVKGQAQIAKDYISEVISGTSYDFYFNQKYATPADALRAGAFNCFDGARVIMAIAQAFGFGGGSMGHGKWGNVNHVWAKIPGLGIIDATALQHGQGFKSPKVKGYSAGGSIRRGKSDSPDMGETHNYNGDVNINIYTDGNNVEVDNRRIDQRTGKQILDILGINPATGR